MGVLETATLVILERRESYQGPDRPVCHHRPQTITRRLAHLMWLPRFDLTRPYQLCQVRPLGLGLVAGGCPTLGYSALEHFLGDLETLRVASPLGDALMRRYLEVWPVPAEGAFFYLDNRRKVHYSSHSIAAGKISASGRVLGATTQLFVHDADGHGLHMHSGPGDDHMTRTVLPFVRRFVPLIGREKIRGIVGDQEMRSVALFLALEAMDNLGFVTIGRTPTAKQEAAFEVEGIFVPYLRDAESRELTHWVAHGHTLLQDRKKGLSFQSEVSLVVDCRAGMPGRLIPVFHNLREEEVPAELPHTVYVGRWESQERVFRDMRACQNLDANYGQKKVVVSNRPLERKRKDLRHKQCTWEKRVTTARCKVQECAEQIKMLEEQVQQKQNENREQVTALRQALREATTPKQREQLVIQRERLTAKGQIQQLRFQEKRRRLVTQQRTWQQELTKRQSKHSKVVQALQDLKDRSFYDLDLEKDNLMTYLQMAGENAHRFVQEQYFAGTLLEKVDESTMVRLVYNRPGWVRQRRQDLLVRLQGYRDPELQAAAAQACRRVNQAQVALPSGHRLRMEVADKILSC
jgi:phosphopantetheine adenylyltransferase